MRVKLRKFLGQYLGSVQTAETEKKVNYFLDADWNKLRMIKSERIHGVFSGVLTCTLEED
jgi:hypothetical protein